MRLGCRLSTKHIPKKEFRHVNEPITESQSVTQSEPLSVRIAVRESVAKSEPVRIRITIAEPLAVAKSFSLTQPERFAIAEAESVPKPLAVSESKPVTLTQSLSSCLFCETGAA